MGDRPIVAERWEFPQANRLATGRPRRIAMISLHTSPTATLGANANGGLNVYVREVCAAFSRRGVATEVFTRCQGNGSP